MPESLDAIMEQASEALARMAYLECEALCQQALSEAREAGRWSYYARILLPLQEARRQRRMIAAEGTIRLGTETLPEEPRDWIEPLSPGCVAVTRPHGPEHARELDAVAREAQHHLEVLFIDNPPAAEHWTIRSFKGPTVTCSLPAPPAGWVDQPLQPGETPEPASDGTSQTPADWFLDASEALGDAALEKVNARSDAIPGSSRRVLLLEEMLAVVTDHEILHQRLSEAARAVPA